MDLTVIFCGGKLTTDLHVKPTDRHQCLYYTSAFTFTVHIILTIRTM